MEKNSQVFAKKRCHTTDIELEILIFHNEWL